jgi:hypothetical protein
VDKPYVVAPTNYAFDGQVVGSVEQHNTDRLGVNLWQVNSPLRLTTITTGVEQYGDIDRDAGATLHAYACRSGTFVLTLLVKEPQTDRIYLNGHLVARHTSTGTETWYPRLHVAPTAAGDNRVCVLKVQPGGLLGSTQFAWQPTTAAGET